MTTRAPDVTMRQGERRVIRAQIYDTAGAVANLSGYTGIEFRLGDIRVGVSYIVKAGSLYGPGEDGLVEAEITAAESAAIRVRDWDYIFECTDADGYPMQPAVGLIRMNGTLPDSVS